MVNRERVRDKRRALRLTQTQIADAIGQDQAYVSKIERGIIKHVRWETLTALAESLGVTPLYLLGEEEEEAAPRQRRGVAVRV